MKCEKRFIQDVWHSEIIDTIKTQEGPWNSQAHEGTWTFQCVSLFWIDFSSTSSLCCHLQTNKALLLHELSDFWRDCCMLYRQRSQHGAPNMSKRINWNPGNVFLPSSWSDGNLSLSGMQRQGACVCVSVFQSRGHICFVYSLNNFSEWSKISSMFHVWTRSHVGACILQEAAVPIPSQLGQRNRKKKSRLLPEHPLTCLIRVTL